jgi:radical SAM protein with 4Fe4S-binding SPASM domain
LFHRSFYYDNEQASLPQQEGRLAAAIENYRDQCGLALNPRWFLERAYQRRVAEYLRSGRTPVLCHALRSSCFLDPEGRVYPCITYEKPIANVRDHGYDIARVWRSDVARELQSDIWKQNCPQCWTPCEAYQSICGNLLRWRA